MCTTCGCGAGETRIEGEAPHEHTHRHADGTVHSHPHVHEGEHGHDHGPEGTHEHSHRHADGTVHSHPQAHEGDHAHEHTPRFRPHTPEGSAPHEHGDGWHTHADGTTHRHGADLHYGLGPARAHAPGLTQARMVKIEADILSHNAEYADRNRRWMGERGVFAVNLVSSPGSGKTTLLVESIRRLAERHPVAVIEGDQQTSNDADRIRATGVPAIQVNTGKGCHLDARMVGQAMARLKVRDNSVLMIENVGNLVCPAGFDLGEAHKVVVLSVTEGEDKPLKYPDMFHAASLMLLNKVDLLPHLNFDVERCIENARRVNPEIRVIRSSATSGEGLDQWLAWIGDGLAAAAAARQETVDGLRRRMAELEAELALLRREAPSRLGD